MVSAGKLRELWDSLSELRSSACERQLERIVLRSALLPVKTAQFTQFFPSAMTSHSKIAQFNKGCIGGFRVQYMYVCMHIYIFIYRYVLRMATRNSRKM